jgi:hypothetical protein
MIRTGLSPNTVDTSQIHVSNARCTEVMQRVLSSIRSLPQGDMLLELQSVPAPRPRHSRGSEGKAHTGQPSSQNNGIPASSNHLRSNQLWDWNSKQQYARLIMQQTVIVPEPELLAGEGIRLGFPMSMCECQNDSGTSDVIQPIKQEFCGCEISVWEMEECFRFPKYSIPFGSRTDNRQVCPCYVVAERRFHPFRAARNRCNRRVSSRHRRERDC